MPGPWESLYSYLDHSTATERSRRRFDGMRSRRAALAPFASPRDFVTFARDARGSLEEKDAAYADLIFEAKSTESGRFAVDLIWLGLWPGLDGVYQAYVASFGGRRHELVNTIVEGLEHAVRRIDLSRTTRPAATLVKNCRRHVMRRRRNERWFTTPLPDDDAIADCVAGDEDGGVIGRPDTIENDATIESLRPWLAEVIGRDADLVIGVLEGGTHAEMAAQLGLGFDVARKRYQRALERLRTEIVENRHGTCPISPISTAFSQQRPKKGRPPNRTR